MGSRRLGVASLCLTKIWNLESLQGIKDLRQQSEQRKRPLERILDPGAQRRGGAAGIVGIDRPSCELAVGSWRQREGGKISAYETTPDWCEGLPQDPDPNFGQGPRGR